MAAVQKELRRAERGSHNMLQSSSKEIWDKVLHKIVVWHKYFDLRWSRYTSLHLQTTSMLACRMWLPSCESKGSLGNQAGVVGRGCTNGNPAVGDSINGSNPETVFGYMGVWHLYACLLYSLMFVFTYHVLIAMSDKNIGERFYQMISYCACWHPNVFLWLKER